MSHIVDDLSFDDMDFEVPVIEDELPEPKKAKPIYTFDIETDPFKYERFPKPFACGLYDGKSFQYTWGENCIVQMLEIIRDLPPGIIFIHNGGRFDIFYIMEEILKRPALIINSRIVKTTMECNGGYHEIRDSYAIMPFRLAAYQKDEISYDCFEADKRELYKDTIVSYLKGDCVYLHELCSEFVKSFGPGLTIGGTAMKELKKLHTFEVLGPILDKDFRDNFFYGGRVECFKSGVLNGQWKVYDVNSMYPYAMLAFDHPIDTLMIDTKDIRKDTCFITAEGRNNGAFPQRTKDGLRFDIEYGVFSVSIHEWNAALRHGLFEPKKIIRCVNYRNRGTFETFVTKFHNLRKQAKIDGDKIYSIFYKYICNSAYGKFAQNPEKYMEYVITDSSANLTDKGFIPSRVPDDSILDSDFKARDFIVWEKPANLNTRYNVAIGASITGAARSILMEAIATAKNPIYCDTDSVICEELPIAEKDAVKLGAWKLEATANLACIARKKLYALFGENCMECGSAERYPENTPEKCKHFFHQTGCVKMASKGVKLTPDEIRRVCEGEIIENYRSAPSFAIDGSYSFIARRIKL